MSTVPNVDTLNSLGLTQQKTVAKSKDKLGQDDFMRLMMTQLQNQDPMKPMENGEFIAQMAQFASVSGIQDLQKSFGTLAESMNSNQAMMAGGMVGRNVLVPSPAGVLPTRGNLNGVIDLPYSTNDVALGVYDFSGQLVRSIDLGAQAAGPVPFAWDGTMDDGQRAMPGRYELKALAQLDGKSQQVNTSIVGTVASVNINNADKKLTLNVPGVGVYEFGNVKQIM